MIADEWKNYQRKVMPANAGPVQVQECRRAFFAGAAAFLHLLDEIARSPVSDAAAAQQLDPLEEELLAFAEDVRTGKA